MPLYSYRCKSCKAVTDAFRRIAERDDCPPCDECEGNTKKIISTYSVHPDFEPYYDENLESHIESKQHRKKVMQEKGVIEAYGKGWT